MTAARPKLDRKRATGRPSPRCERREKTTKAVCHATTNIDCIVPLPLRAISGHRYRGPVTVRGQPVVWRFSQKAKPATTGGRPKQPRMPVESRLVFRLLDRAAPGPESKPSSPVD